MMDIEDQADNDEPTGNETALSGAVRTILKEVGEDPGRDGLLRTPKRVDASLRYLTRGYHQDPKEVLNNAIFDVEYAEMIVVKDIDLYSLCEHHLLPFIGKAHVAYIPTQKIVGLSKIPRLVEVFARRLQVQERLTNQIAEILVELLDPQGVAVVIEAEHLCMRMRGIQKQNSLAVTSAMRGEFLNNHQTRREFLSHIRTT
jgi:GTP cyclohydrolase IA